MYVGCIAGAAVVEDYQKWFKEAGFKEAAFTDTNSDLNVYLETNEDGTKKSGECCAPVAEIPACCGGVGTKKTALSCSDATSRVSTEKTDLNEMGHH